MAGHLPSTLASLPTAGTLVCNPGTSHVVSGLTIRDASDLRLVRFHPLTVHRCANRVSDCPRISGVSEVVRWLEVVPPDLELRFSVRGT